MLSGSEDLAERASPRVQPFGSRCMKVVEFLRMTEVNGESLGQLGGASLSNCRELRAEGGQREKLTATSQKTLRPVKKELSRREPMRTKRCR